MREYKPNLRLIGDVTDVSALRLQVVNGVRFAFIARGGTYIDVAVVNDGHVKILETVVFTSRLTNLVVDGQRVIVSCE